MKHLKTLALFFLVMVMSLGFVSKTTAEEGLRSFNGMSKSIDRLDMKSGVIRLGEKNFKFDGSTVIKNYKGEVVSSDELSTGKQVTIILDTAQRYLSTPLLKEIRIETADGTDD